MAAVPAAPRILRLLIVMPVSPPCFKSCLNITIWDMFHKITISEQAVHHSHAFYTKHTTSTA